MEKNWAKNILSQSGLDKADRVESIVATPYSEVDRITANGLVYYLKKTPDALFIEASILGFLHQVDHSFKIPKLISADADHHCFLMQSCGEQTLRSLFSEDLNVALLEKAVEEYKRIQKASIAYLPELLALGVPDWRLSRLPEIYNNLIHDEESLKRWGVENDTCRALRGRQKTFFALCENVTSYNLPDALNHSDFQENNMVIDPATGDVSIIDWGEVTISPALWSVVGCFKKLCWRYKVSPDSPEGKPLLKRFMGGWDIQEQDIDDVFRKVSALDWIYYILSLAELEKSTGHFSTEWSSRIKMTCTSFVESCSSLEK